MEKVFWKRIALMPFFVCVFMLSLFAQNAGAVLAAYDILPKINTMQPTIDALLAGYTADNTNIKKLEVALQKALLELERSQLKGAPDVNLSTGSISASLSKDSRTFSASPQATLTLPSIANTEIKAEAPVSVTTYTNGSKEKVSWSGSGVSISADIISSARKSQDVAVQKALRGVTEAQRALQKEQLAQKKQFLTDVKALYTKASALISAKNSLYDDELELEKLKAQGYAASSAAYRTAVMERTKSQQSVLEKKRAYESALRLFTRACGSSLTALPVLIPEEDLLDVATFSMDQYADIESSNWAHEYNNNVRDAETDFTLKAQTGYIYKETAAGKSSETHNVNGGLSATYKGLNMSAGVSVPVNKVTGPTFSLSLGWDLGDSRSAALDKKTDNLDIQSELLNITSSQEAYAKMLESTELKRTDLLWYRQQYADELKLYEEFYNETKGWFSKGLIPESQLTSAQRNYTNAVLNQITNKLDWLLYNVETRVLFVMEAAQ